MYILAQALRRVGLDTVYGLVGIPVTEAAYAMQKCDVKFVGFRFEQQAGMAAATHGYLTKNRAFCSLSHRSDSSTASLPQPTPR